MNANTKRISLAALALIGNFGNAMAAGHLVVENGWIRSAPPGAAMLAGYGTLHNVGDAPVVVTGVESADFASASLHKSMNENGVEHMRALGDLQIAPGQRVAFAPGGNHVMLMQPKKELRTNESVPIHFLATGGDSVVGIFVVRDDAPKP
ncbi:MAG TPA: copper chaperone PCu(A)C [Rudaea sp.]|nr:copper chaperone PCu(A)C [Rudaea sp.]